MHLARLSQIRSIHQGNTITTANHTKVPACRARSLCSKLDVSNELWFMGYRRMIDVKKAGEPLC